jgi:hypothetical protein
MCIKPRSRFVVAARGNDETSDDPCWPLVDNFPVLGHVLSNSGSVRACWKNIRNCMWRASWRNSGTTDVNESCVAHRLKLMCRTVVAIFDHRNTRCPPQVTFMREVNRVQRKMVQIFLKAKRNPGESIDSFCRRRAREAGAVCRGQGLWAERWQNRCKAWSEHCSRPRWIKMVL